MTLADQEEALVELYHDPSLRDRVLLPLRRGRRAQALRALRTAGLELAAAELEPFRRIDPRRMRLWTVYEMRMFFLRERINPAFAVSALGLAALRFGSFDCLVEAYFSSPASRRYELEPLERFGLFALGLARSRLLLALLAHELRRAERNGLLPGGRVRSASLRSLLAARSDRERLADVEAFEERARGLPAFQDLLFRFDDWGLLPRLSRRDREAFRRALRSAEAG